MIHWVDAKLRAWGEWFQTGRGMGSAGLTANWDGVGGGGVAGPLIPVKSLEASRTHDWVIGLPRDEQVLLLQIYTTPSTMRESAATLKVSLRTMYSRLHQVHVKFASRVGHAKPPEPRAYVAGPRRTGNG